MFELKELEKQTVKINGEIYPISRPTVGQIKKMSKRLKDEDATEEMISFVSKLGIPTEVLEELPAVQFNSLVEYIVGTKKN